MSVNYVALGKRIGYFRMQCGNITQEALASKINRSREFLAKIEKGTEHPSIATLVDIADALCIVDAVNKHFTCFNVDNGIVGVRVRAAEIVQQIMQSYHNSHLKLQRSC